MTSVAPGEGTPWVRYMERAPRWLIILLAAAAMAAVGVLDHRTGAEISFSIFYVIPVSMTAWAVGPAAGILFSIAAAVVWFAIDHSVGPGYTHPLIPYWNAVVRLAFFLIIARILSALKTAVDAEARLARTDPLTEIHNGRSFFEIAQRDLQRARRSGAPVSLAYIDVDDFKTVNDRFGHEQGDLVLRSMARTIRSSLRATDVVARLGGDEFAILFPDIGSEQALAVMSKVHQKLKDLAREQAWPVSFSIGIVTGHDPDMTTEELLRRADALMYDVKKAGKDGSRHVVLGDAGVAASPISRRRDRTILTG